MSMQQVYTAAPGKKWRYSLNGQTGAVTELEVPPESDSIRPESDSVRFAGSHEWKFWQHTPDRDEMATPLTDLAKGAIEHQKSFKPTAKLPAPYMQLPKHSMHSHGDLHDLAAVVAGTKPAAEVSYPQEKYHGEMAPHVRSLIAEAARRGHKIMITGSGPYKGKLFIGHPEHARQLAKDEVDFQSGRIKGDKDHEEFSRRRGRMLGYPDESIEDFLDAIRTGRDMWDQEGNRLSLASPPVQFGVLDSGGDHPAKILSGMRRKMSWGDEPDIVAREILADKKANEILGHIPHGSSPLGGGVSAVALRKPDGGVVRIGKNTRSIPRPRVEGLLQPTSSHQIGDWTVEHLPYAETKGVTEDHVRQMEEEMRRQGHEFHDPGTDNVGLLPGGKPVILDPGAVRKMPAQLSLAAPSQKQTRESAFGYLEMPQGAIEATFAQCAGCSQMVDDGRCLSFRPGDKVKPIGACNLYIYGTPVPAGEVEESCFGMSKPEDSGYVERAVRCGNCSSLDTDDKSRIHCDLYSHLNKQMPEYWQLREEVRPSSCCNAQTGGKRRLSLGLTRLSASDTSEPGVYLFRHGKTKLNTDGESPDLIRGWIDVPLDDKGKAQAEKLGPLGTKFDIKKVYSSDLERAKATADSIAEDAGLKVDATKSLRPWNLGEFQGKSAKDVAPKLKHYATETPGENVPDGESFEDYANRYLPFLQSVMDEHEKTGENIAIVTHYRNCKLTEAWVADGCGNGLDGDVFFTDDLPTGAVLRLYRQGGKWKCDRVAVPGMKMSLKIRFADTIGPSSSDTSSGRPEKRRRFEVRPHPSGQGHSIFDTHTGEHFDTHTGERISGPEEEHVAKAAAELTNAMFERREAAGKPYPESEQKEPAADPVRAEEDAGGDVLGKAKKAMEEIGAHGSGGVIGKHVQITPEHREALKGLHTAASKKFEEKAAANPAYMEFRRLENEHRNGGTTFNMLGASRLKNGGPGAQVSQQGAGHGAEITVPDDVYKMIQQREALNGEVGLGSHLGLSNEAIHGRSTRNITDPANSAMELLGEGKSNPVSEQKEPAADPARAEEDSAEGADAPKPAAKKYTNETEVNRVAQTTPDALKPHVEEMMADKTPDEKKAIRDAVQAEVDGNPGGEERKVADQAKQELVEVATGKKPRAPGSYKTPGQKDKPKGEVEKTLPGMAASPKQAGEISGEPWREKILGDPPPIPPEPPKNQPNLPFPEEPKPQPPQPAVKGETVTPEPHSVGSHQVGQTVTFQNPHTQEPDKDGKDTQDPVTGRIAEIGENSATIHTHDGGSVTVPLTHPVQMETHERAPQPLSSFKPGHEVEFEHPGKKGQVVHGKVVGTHKDRGRAGKPGSEYVVVESNGQQLRIPKETLAQHANPHEPATPPGAAGRDLRQEHLPGMGPAGPIASAPPKTPGQQKIQWPKEKIAGPPESMELPKQDRDKSIDALARNKNRTPEEDAQLNDLLGAPEGATYEGSGTPDPQGPSYHVVNYLGRRYFMDAERPGEMVAVEPEPNGQHKAYKHENGKMTPPVPVPPRVPKPPETGTTFDEPKEKAPVPKLESERLQRVQGIAQSILKDGEAKADKKTKEEAGEARKKGEDFISKLAGGKGWPHALKVIGLILGSYIALRSLRRHPAGLGLMLGLAGLYFWSKHQAKGKEQGEAGSDEDAQKGAEDLMGHMTPEGDPRPKWKWNEPGDIVEQERTLPAGSDRGREDSGTLTAHGKPYDIEQPVSESRPIDRLEEVGPGEAEEPPPGSAPVPKTPPQGPQKPVATPVEDEDVFDRPEMQQKPSSGPRMNPEELERHINTETAKEATDAELNQSQKTTSAQQQAAPASQPVSPASTAHELEELKKMGGGMVGSMYDALYGALSQGKSHLAGVKDPVLAAAKPAFDAGLIKSSEDLQKWVAENYRKSPKQPDTQQSASPQMPKGPVKVGSTPIHELTPDIVNDELRSLQTKGESGELPSDLQGRYGLVKFLAGVDLNDMPDTAAKRASDYIISQGGDAQVAQRLSDVVRDYVHRHGTNRMLKYRKENGGSQMSLGDPVRLPFLEGMSQSDRLRQLLHKKEWATFSPDEYEEYVHLLKQAGDQEDAGMKQENDEHRNRWNAYWDAYKSPGERPGEHPQQKRHRRYGELYHEFRQRGHGTPQAHENAARALKDEDSPDVRMSLDNVFELAWTDFCDAGGNDTEENFQRLHRDVVRLSMGHRPDEVMTQIGDHIRSLSSAGR